MRSQTVLVTGASSGLGLAAVNTLSKSGFHVLAATRSPSSVFNGFVNTEQISIDLMNVDSITHTFTELQSRPGFSLWGIVNNAGICIPGPLEMLSVDNLREQIETNVIGQFAVTRAALPAIRESRGRIVNVTSGLGSIAVPYLGAYSIAQFAKMAFTDALRRELLNSGVAVTVVQPGAIFTPIWEKFARDGAKVLDGDQQTTRPIYERSFLQFLESSENGARTSSTKVGDFSEVILEVLTAKRPELTYFVGEDARQFSEQARCLLGSEIDDWFRGGMPTAAEFGISEDQAKENL